MCAHLQGQVLNTAKLGSSLNLTGPAIRARLEFLEEALFVRLLPSWEGNLKKRLVKAPKLYLRDSGLCHALLGIESLDDLLAHPVWGASWEAYCIESICTVMDGWHASFFRSSNGAEMDLVLEKGSRRKAFEFKASSAPSVGKGFHSALADLAPETCHLVSFVDSPYPIAPKVTVSSLVDCLAQIQE